MQRDVFFISDGTGITVETLANSLITQFEGVRFIKHTYPYIDTADKANLVGDKINQLYDHAQIKPLVFISLIDRDLRNIINDTRGTVFDLFSSHLEEMEEELQLKSTPMIGRSHGMFDCEKYEQRIDAVNFALSHDDGLKTNNYELADLIIVGVSRCGKTPTSLYLALQFGVKAANYPLIDEELAKNKLPNCLKLHKNKVFGLVIDHVRLHNIRHERRPNSKYSSLDQCRLEAQEIRSMFIHEGVPFLDTTSFSVEEISTKIIAATGLKNEGFR